MKTIGYAVVGTGYFGAELARIMKEQEGARVVAVYLSLIHISEPTSP